MLQKIGIFVIAVLIVFLLLKVVAWAAALLALGGLGDILKWIIIIGFLIWVIRWAIGGFKDILPIN